MKTKDIKKKLLKKSDKPKAIQNKDLLGTGSTILNLACSGKIAGGYPKGYYVLIVGDSSSGKTFFAMTCLAEANINPEFDNYRFIFDNAENGSTANYAKFFGQKTVDRIEPPKGTKEDPEHSSTLEDFYANIDGAIEEGTPFIYVLDSMDAIQPKEEIETQTKKNKAVREGKKGEDKGSYGTGKAKMNSQNLRIIANKLKKTGSILIIISQTRDNIGWGSQFNPKTRSGGNALRFYARLEFWTSVVKKLKTSVNGIDRTIGAITKVKFKKNHFTGWEGEIEIPHYRSTGFDDLGGCVDYLVTEGVWSESGKVINAKDFAIKAKREALVRQIEAKGLQKKLRLLVRDTWNDIEEKSSIKRESRYA